jgi:hypothetical protein
MKEDTTPIDPTWMSKTGGFARDMTLRDEFAGRAMQSFVAGWIGIKAYPDTDMMVAEHAYRMADAMLKAREAK